MAGRSNYQTCSFQCVRPGELWQCNWLEGEGIVLLIGRELCGILIQGNSETGTIVSLVYDMPNKKITTLLAFSKGESSSWISYPFLLDTNILKGHWENPHEAHGDKRNAADFARWRQLAKIGIQTDRYMLAEQADIVEVFRGKGELQAIEEGWPTL